MARVVRTFGVRSRAPKRKTLWIGTVNQFVVAVPSGTSVIIAQFDPSANAILGGTVVRTRGMFLAFPTAHGADLNYAGAYGLGVVSDEAFAAGTVSIPRPYDDDDWPGWLVHGYWGAHLEFQGAQSEMISKSEPFDSKAMRKVGPNETLVWMAESQTGSVQVSIQARMLMKLS